MSDIQNKEKTFVAYEYKRVTVHCYLEGMLKDSYHHFGWKLEKSEPAVVKHVWVPLCVVLAPLALIPGSPVGKMIVDHGSETKITLTFKRDKLICNKTKLNRLQSRFEASVKMISSLDKSKRTTAAALSCVVGLIGTVFIGISIFGYLAGMLPLSIVMAVPGFAGWILPYFIYQAAKNLKTSKVAPQIDKLYDIIYDLCAKADTFLIS
ncbi:hypothetical protein NIE88_17275 [Sporolactobacillus shoreicorticis]|uniref:Uncharacterized protein n=1 Tax=Sporolactobacillus shoreicorticis TaxID=1923877 RepID=A0ABW5S143_9BACL|nr:hypothetical protein [Sporolactobacillus shoreicorticis]MCO7127511.1 hypothetical protein [Sporolactobacillus shoreicorticis]